MGGLGTRLRSAVLGSGPTQPSTSGTDTEDPRNKIAGILAGGFSVAIAGLIAVGVKDGSLDRILRNEAQPAIFVFALIAIAVGCGVIAPALSNTATVKGWSVPAALVVAVVVVTPVLPPTGHLSGVTRVTIAITGLVLVALVFILVAPKVSQKSALIALGLGFFALGLYGAFKLAVDSKSATDRVQVSAGLIAVDGKPALHVTAKADALKTDQSISVTVDGRQPNGSVEQICALDNDARYCGRLVGQRSGGDETGIFDGSLDVPLPVGRYKELAVRVYTCDPPDEKPPKPDAPPAAECRKNTELTGSVNLTLPPPPSRPHLAVTFGTPDANGVTATVAVTAEQIDAAGSVHVVVFDESTSAVAIAQQTAGPDSSASVETTLVVQLGSAVDRLCAIATGTDASTLPPTSCTPGPRAAFVETSVPHVVVADQPPDTNPTPPDTAAPTADESSSFGSVVPARLLDTRAGTATVDGLFSGAGKRAAGSVTEVQIASRGGVSPGAEAAVLNVTIVDASAPGYATVFPCDATPNASNLNYLTGETVPNVVIAKLSSSGKVCVFVSAETDLVVDVNGQFVKGSV